MGDDRSREKRWLLVTADGGHGTLGRATDPSPEELDRLACQLDESGIAGWLVVSEGAYHRANAVRLMMVRRLSAADGDWAEAERLWHERRAEALIER